MMEDLAMHILEILMNSIKADSTKIILRILDSFEKDIISFSIEDDGKGMDEDMVQRAADPFTTSRTTRRIGMGLAFTYRSCIVPRTDVEYVSLGENGYYVDLVLIFPPDGYRSSANRALETMIRDFYHDRNRL